MSNACTATEADTAGKCEKQLIKELPAGEVIPYLRGLSPAGVLEPIKFIREGIGVGARGGARVWALWVLRACGTGNDHTQTTSGPLVPPLPGKESFSADHHATLFPASDCAAEQGNSESGETNPEETRVRLSDHR